MEYKKAEKIAWEKAIQDAPTINGLFDIKRRIDIYINEMFHLGWIVEFGGTWNEETLNEFAKKHELDIC